MAALSARGTLVPALVVMVHTAALAQTAAAPARPPAGPSGASAAWTLKLKGDVRWQQVTPAGALLVSTDAALAGVDIERGQITWEKPSSVGCRLTASAWSRAPCSWKQRALACW